MTSVAKKKRDLIEGRAALIVIDIQAGTFVQKTDDERAIPHMQDYDARMLKSRAVIDKARECNVPVIFIQEIHRANLVDFGRELDGDEDIHCLDNNPDTDLAKEQMGFIPGDYHIQKRRYSAFFGTDLEILLRGLKVQTLLLVGGLTDVCVHYTFVDGHQSDYFCRVLEDCVAGSSLEAHEASLKAMQYLQNGAVCTREQVILAMSALNQTLPDEAASV